MAGAGIVKLRTPPVSRNRPRADPSTRIPERPREPRLPQQGLLDRSRGGSPIVTEAASIPAATELPQRFDRHRRAWPSPAPPPFPGSRIPLRPEGHDVASGVADVVPEAARGNRKADDGASRPNAATSHGQFERHSRPGACRARKATCAQEQRYRDCVPRAVRPVRPGRGLDAVRRGDGREGVGHPNLAAFIQGEDMGFGEEAECLGDLCLGRVKVGAKLGARRYRSRLPRPAIEMPAEAPGETLGRFGFHARRRASQASTLKPSSSNIAIASTSSMTRGMTCVLKA